MFSDWRLDIHDGRIIALIRIIMIKDKKVDTTLCVQVIVGTLDIKLCVQAQGGPLLISKDKGAQS